MNQHIQRVKNIITNYHEKAVAADAAMKKAVEEYKPELARERVADIRARLQTEKENALAAIRRATEQGAEEYTSKWQNISGEDITPDAKLLDSGMTISQSQFDDLCRKYTSAGNNTMVRLLADYAEANNKRRSQENPGDIFPPGYLTTRQLPTPEKNGQEWERAARSAEKLIGQMDGGGWMQGANDSIVTSSVEHFGENLEL